MPLESAPTCAVPVRVLAPAAMNSNAIATECNQAHTDGVVW
jgi:hypothetical protein